MTYAQAYTIYTVALSMGFVDARLYTAGPGGFKVFGFNNNAVVNADYIVGNIINNIHIDNA